MKALPEMRAACTAFENILSKSAQRCHSTQVAQQQQGASKAGSSHACSRTTQAEWRNIGSVLAKSISHEYKQNTNATSSSRIQCACYLCCGWEALPNEAGIFPAAEKKQRASH